MSGGATERTLVAFPSYFLGSASDGRLTGSSTNHDYYCNFLNHYFDAFVEEARKGFLYAPYHVSCHLLNELAEKMFDLIRETESGEYRNSDTPVFR